MILHLSKTTIMLNYHQNFVLKIDAYMKEYSYIKRAILRELSHNARIPNSVMAKKLKCSRNTVISNIKALEDEFGLKYTMEFHRKLLGIVQNQLWSIRFGIKPSMADLRKIFKDDNSTRFVARTAGDFDLFINYIGVVDDEYTYWALDTVTKLLPYKPIIKPSSVALTHYGFFPIPNPLLKKLSLDHLGLDSIDKEIILLLNDNSRISYTEMSNKLGINLESVRYRIRRLLKTNLIRRFTAVSCKPPTNYNMIFFTNFQASLGLIERTIKAKEYYTTVDGKLPVINAIQCLMLASGSYTLFGIGCLDNEDEAVKKVIMSHRNIYREDNLDITYAKITNVIKGTIPIRNIDIEKEFNAIRWGEYKNAKKAGTEMKNTK